MSYQSVFLHQTPSKSTEIVHPRGNHQLVKVVTRKYDPAHKPLLLFCLILASREGGVVFVEFYSKLQWFPKLLKSCSHFDNIAVTDASLRSRLYTE